MSGNEGASERVKQNRLKQAENICFVFFTKQIYSCFFLHFCFTRSLMVHSKPGKAQNKPAESRNRVRAGLRLPFFSVLMNVCEGYRYEIADFALSAGKI
jgi:hypothetical protein